MKQILLGLFLVLSIPSFSQKTTLLKCGKLLDTKTGTVLQQQFVLIKKNIIISISNTPSHADTMIDLSNYFVLPGLIDAHTHILLQGDITSADYDEQLLKESIPYRTLRASKSAARALLNGFTTIRDLGTEGAGFADVDVKKAINNGIITGPRMQVSTLAMNTTGHYPIKTADYAWELKLPKGRPAGQPVDVTFSYDQSGVIHVEFLDVNSKKKHEADLRPESSKSIEDLRDELDFKIE